MVIISFAWTTFELLNRKKTVTRRVWRKCSLRAGDKVQAWDKSPRFGGRKIAILEIVNVSYEKLNKITDADEKKEGGLWKSKQNFIKQFLIGHPELEESSKIYRIEFKVLEITKDGKEVLEEIKEKIRSSLY